MASLLDPRCGVPSFQQTDENLVRNCAKKSGMIVGLIIGGISLISVLVTFFNSKKTEDTIDPETGKLRTKNSGYNYLILVIGIPASVLLYYIFYLIVPFFSVNSWKSMQAQINSCMSQGRSRSECMKSIQDWQQQQMRARAQLQAGEDIASAIRESSNRR